MIIKKRFGKRNFVQYLGLNNDDYSLVPKKKKKKVEYIPGVDVTYRNPPGSQAEFEAQQLANSVRFIPHRFEDSRAYRYTAKSTPPVVHSYDRMPDTDARRVRDLARRAASARAWKKGKGALKEYSAIWGEIRAYDRVETTWRTWEAMQARKKRPTCRTGWR